MFNEIAADFDAGIFSNDNAFFKYAKDISPVVGDNRVVSDYYYNDKSLHVKNSDALVIDFGKEKYRYNQWREINHEEFSKNYNRVTFEYISLLMSSML